MYSALQSDNSVKDTVTQLCTDLDGMFNEVADIFKKKILNTEVPCIQWNNIFMATHPSPRRSCVKQLKKLVRRRTGCFIVFVQTWQTVNVP